jgi:hypothetical protein
MVIRKASSKGIHTTTGLLLKGTLPDGIDSRQVDESFVFRMEAEVPILSQKQAEYYLKMAETIHSTSAQHPVITVGR